MLPTNTNLVITAVFLRAYVLLVDSRMKIMVLVTKILLFHAWWPMLFIPEL